ncbi:molybdenum cofactor biosysynthesis protein [Altererythrobacter sp. B11]|uniref:MOSC domain-containing protein n=1 Tax=Altererythrobacter sp. B11 TaxID=2060312 RepID=UPI000DC7289F|nr:MOSC domain-containing protein [Altererythrobacter sp. B11]BBC72664.1 molybdenum cofactor biosysynthesis protein [Altererythrobacter sp. B11]
MGGKLAGIARHDRPKGAMERLDAVSVTSAAGVAGDYRGALASGKLIPRRQVSLIEAESWAAALADCGGMLDWWHARRNLLVSGLGIPHRVGTRIAIGKTLVIEVLDECDPCERMEALHPGLRAAMAPDWRGGFLGRVLADGEIAVGDEARII